MATHVGVSVHHYKTRLTLEHNIFVTSDRAFAKNTTILFFFSQIFHPPWCKNCFHFNDRIPTIANNNSYTNYPTFYFFVNF